MAPSDAPPDFAPLRTERLALRALRAEDAAALHRLVNDWDVAKTLARVPFPYPRDLADEWIASTWAQIAAGEAWHLAIADEDDALVGCVGLTLNRGKGRAELGYWVGRRHWGKGLGPEAAGRLARWALDDLGVGAVHASALRDNTRSISVSRVRQPTCRTSGLAGSTFSRPNSVASSSMKASSSGGTRASRRGHTSPQFFAKSE